MASKPGYKTYEKEIDEPIREVIDLDSGAAVPASRSRKRKRITIIDFTQDDDDDHSTPPAAKVTYKTCMSCTERKVAAEFHEDEASDLVGEICTRCWDSNFYAEQAREAQKEKECSICYDTIPSHRFPAAPHAGAERGKHTVCFSCFEQHLHSQIERKAWDKLTCPQDGCGQVLEYSEITKLDRSFEQKIEPTLSVHATSAYLKNDESYFACPSGACKSGAIIEDGHDQGTFSCEACGHQYCFACKIPMHIGQSCAAYRTSLKDNSRKAADEKATEEVVAKLYKACPKCSFRLELMSGCDHVVCLGCQHSFNWSTVQLDAERGRILATGAIPAATAPPLMFPGNRGFVPDHIRATHNMRAIQAENRRTATGQAARPPVRPSPELEALWRRRRPY